MENALKTSLDLLSYINASPTASHAVENTSKLLLKEGFVQLLEGDAWNLKANKKYFTIRQDTALSAWVMGDKPSTEAGIRFIGAHTDSPGFRIKSKSPYEKNGYLQLGVEVYGGPILASWTDRDLGIAGRVMVKTDGKIVTKLYRSKNALVKIALPAIHLNREVNTKGLLLNKQTQLPPIFGLNLDGEKIDSNVLTDFLATELRCDASDIIHWDLELYDTADGQVLGLNQDFISVGRIDNLAMCHASIDALIHQEKQAHTNLVVLFDSEEIGSQTINGANGAYIETLFARIMGECSVEEKAMAFSKSFCISADGAHAIHPNYTEFYEPQHHVELNKGPVIKINTNHRYASSNVSISVFKELCKDVEVPLQEYIHRTDLPCGSTIGPMTASRLGIPVADVGNAMLGMHSIRETAGSKDQEMMITVLKRFFDKIDLNQVN